MQNEETLKKSRSAVILLSHLFLARIHGPRKLLVPCCVQLFVQISWLITNPLVVHNIGGKETDTQSDETVAQSGPVEAKALMLSAVIIEPPAHALGALVLGWFTATTALVTHTPHSKQRLVRLELN